MYQSQVDIILTDVLNLTANIVNLCESFRAKDMEILFTKASLVGDILQEGKYTNRCSNDDCMCCSERFVHHTP